MRIFPYIAVAAVLTAGVSGAATFTVDFDTPAYDYVDDPAVDGKDGWTQSHSNPPPEDGFYTPYAWISSSFGAGNSVAYGGFYDEVPNGFNLSREFLGLTAGEKSLSFQNHITDCTELYEGRDAFGFQVRDSGGDLLLTVNLQPTTQTLEPDGEGGFEPGAWEIFYAFGSDSSISTTNAILATGINFFSVDFGVDGLTFNYGQGDSAQHTVSGTAAGYDVNDTEIDLTFTYGQIGNGDNYVRIDNINVVDGIPEPTTAALAALGGLALLRRRRVN